MFLLWCVLCVSSLHGVLSQVQLVQPSSEIRKPGESVKISCKTSGFTFTSYYMHWIQQVPGNGLKWIGRIDPEDGETIYSSSFEGRFTMTTDNSITTAYLQIDRLSMEDSATYYCARDTMIKRGDLSYKNIEAISSSHHLGQQIATVSCFRGCRLGSLRVNPWGSSLDRMGAVQEILKVTYTSSLSWSLPLASGSRLVCTYPFALSTPGVHRWFCPFGCFLVSYMRRGGLAVLC
ncbi:immunoglobulin gamma-1 heavy chain-like [Bufo gargarizans]|uniref:immunoglobulin gamma-1 heavy chain-like n=1 Tax=Bufo gargarizans TaxID=30331 RepID=UPI001CF5A855|nr:immunoglobulin gamma-1 heavy chain-like [Bufo gargarizans]